MSDTAQVDAQIREIEATRNILSDTIRFLKSGTVPGSEAHRMAGCIQLADFMFRNADGALKDLKKSRAKGDLEAVTEKLAETVSTAPEPSPEPVQES